VLFVTVAVTAVTLQFVQCPYSIFVIVSLQSLHVW